MGPARFPPSLAPVVTGPPGVPPGPTGDDVRQALLPRPGRRRVATLIVYPEGPLPDLVPETGRVLPERTTRRVRNGIDPRTTRGGDSSRVLVDE